MKKRILALLLLASILLSNVACGKKDEPKDTVNDKVTNNQDHVEDLLKDNLPEKDYNKDKFTIYVGTSAFFGSFIAEEETGDLINDAIYARDAAIEDRFNIDLEYIKGLGSTGSETSKTSQAISNYIQAGDSSFDAYVHVQHSGMPALILENMFIDWKDMPYVNLEKPWWYQNIKRDLSFGDSIYTMTGDLSLYVQRSGCLAFNKTMFDDLGLDYPYEMVKNKEWTYDEFLKLCKLAKKDLNGDDTIDVDNDRYGYTGWSWEMLPALYIGMGGITVGKDDSNLPVLSMNNERTFTVIDNIVNLFKEEGVAWCNSDSEKYSLCTGDMFKSGRLMFSDSILGSVTGYRDMEDDFGIIPFPMLNVDQGEYFSRSPNFTPLFYIPVTNNDLEKTSIILEGMTAYSYKNVTPVLFDTVLTLKGVRDVESEEMLPLIRDSSRFWYEGIIGAGDLISLVEKGQNTFASDYAANESIYLEALSKMQEFYEK